MMQAEYIQGGAVRLTVSAGERLTVIEPSDGDPGHALIEGQYEFLPLPGLLNWEAVIAAGLTVAPLAAVPDNPTLSDWRVGLTLWKREDGTLRIDEVTAKVAALVEAGNPMGRIARERLEYANNVLRAQLVQLKGPLGFSEAEIDASLWRADRVRQGDLSGQWPLPADKGTTA